MKPLKESIRRELAARFGLDDSGLEFLAGGREDSDGVVFTTMKDGEKKVFKISQAFDEEHVKNILEFAHYLGACGIQIGSPIRNEYGNIYEVAMDGENMLIATLMDFIEGNTRRFCIEQRRDVRRASRRKKRAGNGEELYRVRRSGVL